MDCQRINRLREGSTGPWHGININLFDLRVFIERRGLCGLKGVLKKDVGGHGNRSNIDRSYPVRSSLNLNDRFLGTPLFYSFI